MRILFLVLLFPIVFLYSCEIFHTPLQCELAPESVRTAAFAYAQKYAELGAVYEWGGQDPLPKTIKVDCSGLVVRCYQYACSDFGYSLPFTDMNAAGMERYCNIVSPEIGDLIFMGDNNIISHVAIFEKFESEKVYFIDSTSITGVVSERNYPITSSKIIKYGRIHLYHY
jgi:hypothetical protein